MTAGLNKCQNLLMTLRKAKYIVLSFISLFLPIFMEWFSHHCVCLPAPPDLTSIGTIPCKSALSTHTHHQVSDWLLDCSHSTSYGKPLLYKVA
ncbi:hypothetical protein AB205_0006930 [Aquarana catesbeiana]|uniref:Uncharacterized protein n=1 Tax=Aquarana catesbeiana TaxID=8400 RepID=A0A2G9S257_AQUCT|nr:hypothetical protein AB205_0006930 [Aquarana catesbeiana]